MQHGCGIASACSQHQLSGYHLEGQAVLFEEAQGRVGDKGDAVVVDRENDRKAPLLVPPPPAQHHCLFGPIMMLMMPHAEGTCLIWCAMAWTHQAVPSAENGCGPLQHKENTSFKHWCRQDHA